MTIQELEAKLTANIKTYLKSTGHVKTGQLLNSLQVNVSYNDKFKMSVNGLEYMQFLDNEDFLQNFFDLPSTIAILEEYLASTIEDNIGD